MRIDCILPQRSQYDVLHHFTRKVAEALSRLGHRAKVLAAEESIAECRKDPPEAMLAFNGAPQLDDGSFLCDELGVRQYACLVDPPCYYLGLLASPLIQICCDDKEGLKQLEGLGVSNGMFFTQGIEPELVKKHESEKVYDLVFMGSYFDIEEARSQMRAYYPEALSRLIEEAIEATLQDSSLSLEDAFARAVKGKTEWLHGVDLVQLYYVMSYIQKGEARNRLLLSVRNLPVHIWDSRWKPFCEEHCPQAVVHESVSYYDALEIFKNASIILCNSIRSVNGCNERVLNALACGAVPLTNENPYFAEHFKEGQQLLMYSPDALTQNEEKIRHYLQHRDALEDIVDKGQTLILQEHTWDKRLAGIGLT